MNLTVVYDNNAYDPRLTTSWGFGCLITYGRHTILFDTGGDGKILTSNMQKLGLDPRAIDTVVLSHIHGDHTGGLESILAAGGRPTVYVPRSFPDSFKTQVSALVEVREVSGPEEICAGVYTTGELGSGIREQALAVETAKGLIVITGCAHPGVDNMLRAAQGIRGDDVYLVLGGYHLGGASKSKIEGIIAALREMGVCKVAPCHCTGKQATAMFAERYGDDFIRCGVGFKLSVGSLGGAD